VCHDDPEGRVDEKWLGIRSASSPYCGVAGMADSDVTLKAHEIVHREDVSDKTISLFCVEMPIISDNSSRVLAPVLNRQKPLIQVFEDIIVSEDCYYSAHDIGHTIISLSLQKKNHLDYLT